MANSSDKLNGTIGLKSKNPEESDIIELTDELEHLAHGMDDDDDGDDLLEFSMPEFRMPTGSNPAASPGSAPRAALDDDDVAQIPTERLDANVIKARLELEKKQKAALRAAQSAPPPKPAPPIDDVQDDFPEDEVFADMEEISEIVDDGTESLEELIDHEGGPTMLIEPDEETDDIQDAQIGDAPEEFDRQELVRTIQMQAVDRLALDADDPQDTLATATMLLDQRFAPDVIVEPPRILTKKWREGSPLPGAKPPTERPRPKASAPSALKDTSPSAPKPKPKPATPKSRPSSASHKPVKLMPMPGGDEEVVEEHTLSEEILRERPRRIKKRARTMKGRFEVPEREAWFHDVFNEEYFRTLPKNLERQTEREAKFIERSLSLEEGARILDLACGFGRHALMLAQRNFELAGLDLSMTLLQHALNEAQRRSLSIKFIHGDMRSLNFDNIFDGCFIWQTSFGFFDDATNFKVLQGVWRALKPGGRFLIDIPNRDYIVSEIPTRSWWEGHECIFLEEVDFDNIESVLHTKRSFIYEDGSKPLEQNSYLRLYSLHELTALMEAAGLRVLEVSGEMHHMGRFLGPQSSKLLVLAEKVT